MSDKHKKHMIHCIYTCRKNKDKLIFNNHILSQNIITNCSLDFIYWWWIYILSYFIWIPPSSFLFDIWFFFYFVWYILNRKNINWLIPCWTMNLHIFPNIVIKTKTNRIVCYIFLSIFKSWINMYLLVHCYTQNA